MVEQYTIHRHLCINNNDLVFDPIYLILLIPDPNILFLLSFDPNILFLLSFDLNTYFNWYGGSRQGERLGS